MKAWIALTKNELRLAFRDKQVLFFNYLFPLMFFFILATTLHAERGGALGMMIVINVLVIGVLGNGFFGAGIRAVQDREQNILRRFKVAPITPLPILAASLATGLLLFIPSILLTFGLARALYGMPLPSRPWAMLAFLAIGALTFRAIGLIIAAVSNSIGESNLLVQLMYMPMLFLSGAMFPATFLPRWAQTLAQFLPAAYLVSGVQGIVAQEQTIVANAKAVAGLAVAFALSIFVAVRLFRWEKDEKLRPAAKLWVAGVLMPFVVLGLYQFRTHEQSVRNRVLWRHLQRDDSFLLKNAKIFVGDGRIVDSGSVLVRHGRIERVFEEPVADDANLKAEVIEASGKTVLPGLIDVHVHIGAPGGTYTDPKEYVAGHVVERHLVQYLYSGVTTVKSAGDALTTSLALRQRTATGDLLGAELVVSGPLFTTEGGHGTEYFSWLEGPQKAAAVEEFVRAPESPDEARRQVRELKHAGVDAIKAVLESGRAGRLFNRMDLNVFGAVIDEAARQQLRSAVHTGTPQDVEDAVAAGANAVEHGAYSPLPDAVLSRMARAGTTYDPTLSVVEAQRDLAAGRLDLLRRALVQQAVAPKLLSATAGLIKARKFADDERAAGIDSALNGARANLVRAWKAGVPLVTGSDAGNLLVFHGPTVHRELQLWVEAGVPPTVALQAATSNAARLIGADRRIGLVRAGYDANLLVVDGDPTRDISATERISLVVFRGERLRRADLFDETKNPLQ
jgi:imidazolonepropionase-like amidohydrolase/ABC-type multidrug transport system permease subunit